MAGQADRRSTHELGGLIRNSVSGTSLTAQGEGRRQGTPGQHFNMSKMLLPRSHRGSEQPWDKSRA